MSFEKLEGSRITLFDIRFVFVKAISAIVWISKTVLNF